jgi:glycosyltransferase involved in cell wall biosynthesis
MEQDAEQEQKRPKRVGLIFTRYPVLSETFLRREVEALQTHSEDWEVLVMWGSEDPQAPAKIRYRPWELMALAYWIPYWAMARPRALCRLTSALLHGRIPTVTNFFENLLGLGIAICWAKRLSRRYRHLHAVWASGPGTVAWGVHCLTGTPYSLAGHAYDLFEGGGDGWLKWKIPDATFIRTSTLAGRDQWLLQGARGEDVHVIRRGLSSLPPRRSGWMAQAPFRLLSVGRMVEKMGYGYLLALLLALQKTGLSFEAVWVGDGPLRRRLQEQLRATDLDRKVKLTGALPYAEVEQYYAWADLFLFTGEVANSGDRAGFPNALGEAMAWGVPIATTAVGGVTEVIEPDINGLILPDKINSAALQIAELMGNPERCERYQATARAWVEKEFIAERNMQHLRERVAKHMD